MQIEDSGFCEKGAGGEFVSGDTLHFDAGKLPTNTHGGMLSHAYVLGISHVVEVVRQLRGEATAQVPDARDRHLRRLHRPAVLDPHPEEGRHDAERSRAAPSEPASGEHRVDGHDHARRHSRCPTSPGR